MNIQIDLNCDLGEQPESVLDEKIMPYISSCNIACSGHAGNKVSVEKTVALAIQNKVAIGAHPSFPDRENFGRKELHMEEKELKQSLLEQIQLVIEVVNQAGVPLHHIKPHGALYNLAAKDSSTSELICQVVKEIDPTLKLYGLAHSVTETKALKNGINFIGEAFADRKYESNKTLRSRVHENAVLTSCEEVLSQIEELVFRKRAFADDWISISAKTICLHSDTQGAVNLAKQINHHLVNQGAQIIAV